MLRSLASQAAVSLENSRLYEDIQQLFESFVRAAVMAIEQRDPTTSGHSFRVADGTLSLARHVERLARGQWAGARFSAEDLRELRYAALLHDFGKVAVREHVLTKALKLFDEELVTLRARFMLAQTPRIALDAFRSGCRKPYMILRGYVSVYHIWRPTYSASWPILMPCSRSCSTPTSQTSPRRGTIRGSRRSVSEILSIPMGNVTLF